MSWHTVHDCPTAEAHLVCGFLDNDLVATRIVDAKGGEVSRVHLDSAVSPVRIAVRDSDVSLALQTLADLQLHSKRPRIDGSLERLGSSLRACAMSPFAPWGLVLAPRYLWRAMSEANKPREHAWNLAAIVVCGMFTAIYATGFVLTVSS